MKALYATLLAIAVLALAGCDSKDPKAAATAAALPATQTLPTFADPKLNDYVKYYSDAANAYVAAFREKDMNKVIGATMALSNAQDDVRRKVPNLSPEDATKLTDWSTAVNKQVEDEVARLKAKM